MEMMIQNNAVCFYGQIKDLPGFLSAWPAELTLAEFIRLHLN
ncbi:MAG TPA: hypothetical protein PLC88_06390 [Syntrophomonas sp.]|jgi:hypothetical protein|nr:hypothetical protein [Syntrophomonas sp.]HRW13231.1 hypothetical protein [Syntrophomonas sp.]